MGRDDEICGLYRSGNTLLQLKDLFGLSISRLSTILSGRGVESRCRKAIDRELIILMYGSGLSCNEVSKRLGCDRRTIDRVVSKLGVMRPIRDEIAKYDINVKYFSNIDTEPKAYWLGFLFADGSLVHDCARTHGMRVLQISLAQKDLEHLETLRAAFGSGHPISKYKKFVRLHICCQEMARDLVRHGWDEFKSRGAWPKLDSELERHFVRGFFDGDGWVSRSKKRKRIFPEIGLICMHRSVLFESMRVLRINANILNARSKASKVDVWKWRKQGRACSDAHHILYDGASVWLGRKRVYLEGML